MLIIAIPKSASTSLLHTLGKLHDLPYQQDFKSVKKNRIPPAFNILGKYHSDIRELNEKVAQKWTGKDSFFKQHIPPTDQNLNLLRGQKKVILLREPNEIILAYKRADERGIHKKREEFLGCESNEEWLERATEIGLYDELNFFFEKWQNNSGDKLLIYFDDLISNEQETIGRINKYFSLKTDKQDIQLKRYRYSNYNLIQRYLYKTVDKIKDFWF